MTDRSSPDRRPPTDEEIAAFLEGKLDEKDRARVLEHAASDPDTYEVLLESGAMLGSAKREAAPMPAPWTRRHLVWIGGLAAAAGLAALVLGPWAAGPSSTLGDELLAVARSVDATGLSPEALGVDRVVRSGSAPAREGAEAVSMLRAGRAVADLVVSLDAGNVPAAEGASVALRRSTDEVPRLRGLGQAVSDAVAGSSTDEGRTELFSAIEDVARAASPSAAFRLGLWAGTLRLSLLAQDSVATQRLTAVAPEVLADADEEALPPALRRLATEVGALLAGASDATGLLARLDSVTTAP